jgi:hypothetical protein
VSQAHDEEWTELQRRRRKRAVAIIGFAAHCVPKKKYATVEF